MPTKSLENLLNPNEDGDLGDVVRRAREMGELTERLRQSLPTDMADGIEAASIRDPGELVVLASSPAWAAKLRFETEKLQQAAERAGASVSHCTVRVSRGR